MAGRKVFFFVVVDHQRSVEALMIFRLSRSMVRTWDGLLREEPDLETLPAIVPVLLSNSTTGWTAATKFEDVLDTSPRRRARRSCLTSRFAMRLVDLHRRKPAGSSRRC
jgi:Putative transposase, YhgA-like